MSPSFVAHGKGVSVHGQGSQGAREARRHFKHFPQDFSIGRWGVGSPPGCNGLGWDIGTFCLEIGE